MACEAPWDLGPVKKLCVVQRGRIFSIQVIIVVRRGTRKKFEVEHDPSMIEKSTPSSRGIKSPHTAQNTYRLHLFKMTPSPSPSVAMASFVSALIITASELAGAIEKERAIEVHDAIVNRRTTIAFRLETFMIRRQSEVV
jgi:hypothetical protein